MREETIRQFEKEIRDRGFSQPVATRVAWAALDEYQKLRYTQVADITEFKGKSPIAVYIGLIRPADGFRWVGEGYTLEEAALGSLLPHIPDCVRKKLHLATEWRIERDSSALGFTLSNSPGYFDRVELAPAIDCDSGAPIVRLLANGEWCGNWNIPPAKYHIIREAVEYAIGWAVVWRKPLPPAEDIEKLLQAVSPEAAEAAQKEREEAEDVDG